MNFFSELLLLICLVSKRYLWLLCGRVYSSLKYLQVKYSFCIIIAQVPHFIYFFHFQSSDESVNILHHPAHYKQPILFSFNAKNFFGKKKASVRVENGEWSDKFSVDVAGSSGVVNCKANDMTYQVNDGLILLKTNFIDKALKTENIFSVKKFYVWFFIDSCQ